MLSKAEILYLPGQKTIIKSYERILKILIKKMIEVMRIEIPLWYDLFNENVMNLDYELGNEKKGSSTYNKQ